MLWQQRSYQLVNPLNNIKPCGIPVGPLGHRLVTGRQSRKSSKRGLLPFNGTKEDRDHICCSRSMALQGTLHPHRITIIRGHKIGADEEQKKVGGLQMRFLFLLPFRSSLNIAIDPCGDVSKSAKWT